MTWPAAVSPTLGRPQRDVGADLQGLLDRALICELTARYNRAFDDVDVETWVDTFVADGEMTIGDRSWRGHDELRRLITKVGFGMVHLTTDAEIVIDGDRATQRCSAMLLRRFEDRSPVQPITTARYVDELRRLDGAWRFVRRVTTTDSPL